MSTAGQEVSTDGRELIPATSHLDRNHPALSAFHYLQRSPGHRNIGTTVACRGGEGRVLLVRMASPVQQGGTH